MKRVLVTCLCAGLIAGLASCGPASGRKADGAYDQSKRAQGDQRRVLEKSAYMNYKRALMERPDKISPRLRARFLEMAVIRGRMILAEGGYTFEAVPLILEEIDKYWAADAPDEVKNAYGDLLVLLADSGFEHQHILEGLRKIDKAIELAQDKGKFQQARAGRVKNLVDQYLAMANASYTQGKEDEDEESMVRAEFYAQMVLEFDSTNAEAAKVLSACRTANVNTYSLYKKVIQPPPDTVLFKKIDKFDIFLAVAAQAFRGGSVVMEVTMWNYSYNPQRLKAQSFALEDDKGKRYPASPSSKIQPEFLDFEHETKLTLTFTKPAGRIAKFVYDNPPHYSEKRYY